MRRILTHGLMVALGVSVAAGCTEEGPTSVGGELIGEGYRTYEVVLDADAFLQSDLTYTGLGSLNLAPFGIVARDFGGELDARTLLRVRPPTQVTYENDAGTNVTDSAFTIIGGTLTLAMDSLAADRTRPVQVELVEVTESWEPATVSWELRSDTAEVGEPWAAPGGTTGAVLGSGLWASGDTLRIALDSTAAAVWADSAAAFHGGLIRSTTAGTRLVLDGLQFSFDVRPEGADTVVSVASLVARANIATPEPGTPAAGELRVGGVPVWRTVFQFLPMEEVEIPCAPMSTRCTTVPLSQVEVNQAALLLHPLPVPGRRIERPLRIEGRVVLRAPGVPVERSPLSPTIGITESGISPALFTPGLADPDRVAVPVTTYLRQNLSPPEGGDPVLWLALLAELEQAAPLFGYAAFASLESDNPPQLRLVVTVPTEERLP